MKWVHSTLVFVLGDSHNKLSEFKHTNPDSVKQTVFTDVLLHYYFYDDCVRLGLVYNLTLINVILFL